MVLKSFVLHVKEYIKPTKSLSQFVDTALNTTFDLMLVNLFYRVIIQIYFMASWPPYSTGLGELKWRVWGIDLCISLFLYWEERDQYFSLCEVVAYTHAHHESASLCDRVAGDF